MPSEALMYERWCAEQPGPVVMKCTVIGCDRPMVMGTQGGWCAECGIGLETAFLAETADAEEIATSKRELALYEAALRSGDYREREIEGILRRPKGGK